MIETSLNIDSLGKNVQYTGEDVQIHHIYHLLLMKKGSDILNPDKGIDINSYYYAYNKESILNELQIDIQTQIATYTPYTVSDVLCKAVKSKSTGKYILYILIYLASMNRIVAIGTNGEDSNIKIVD